MSSSIAISSVQHRLHHSRGQSQAAANDSSAGAASGPSSIDTSGSRAALASLNALLGHISAAGSIAPGGTTETASTTPADATPAMKPNLDALNRVLAHYAAQSVARDTVIALVKE